MLLRMCSSARNSLVPRRSVTGDLVSTVYACVAPRVFVGNLETTVILVHVARPYTTETRELFTSTRRSSEAVRTPSVSSESHEWC